MTGIIIAAVVVGCVGLILGLFLGFMGKKFAVEVDEGNRCKSRTSG